MGGLSALGTEFLINFDNIYKHQATRSFLSSMFKVLHKKNHKIRFTLLFIIPRIVLLSSIQPTGDTLELLNPRTSEKSFEDLPTT